MNIFQKILKGCEMAHITIKMEKGHYENNIFDKIMIYYYFITDCMR